MEALTVEHLSFCYPEADSEILHDLSFCVRAGEFITLCGLSGSGKTTLLRQFKPALTPHGERRGKILFDGRELTSLSQRDQSGRIGFVQQSPDNQIVTDKVWHELAFGLESLGLPQETIRRRVAETASFFGIEQLFETDVAALSGGQKQLLNLASVMAMQPELLLLDEPTAQLDPIAAADFIACLTRVNRELGTTIIITEHRLESVLPVSDRVLVLENGRLISDDTPAHTGQNLKRAHSACFLSLPSPMRIWDAAENDGGECPVTVAQGRHWLKAFAQTHELRQLPEEKLPQAGEAVITLKNCCFRYGRNAPDVLRHLSLEVRRGELLTVMGGNGTGKSTLLSLLNGTNRPYSGKYISHAACCATLPQNPQVLFDGKTVRETLEHAFSGKTRSEEESRRMDEVIRLCGLQSLLSRHPFDLSGGEMQKAALAKLLLLKPDVLLLDEPTKGLDASFKEPLAAILQKLTAKGVAVVMISHDMEFCARSSHRCVLLFNGELAAGGTPREFFSGNSFYVTSAARMAREMIFHAVTAEDVIFACTGRAPLPPEHHPDPPCQNPEPDRKKRSPEPKRFTFKKQKLKPRTILSALMLWLLIPVTIFVGVVFLDDRRYLFISLLIVLESMLPFFLVFEGRKPQARELVLVAVLCALTVAGRAAFAALPQVKPVLALVIISGVALGGETGFVVGAVSMLLSNMLFGQGAWTPWQMFSAGIIGFMAGVLFRRGISAGNRGALSVFGFLAAVLLYGGVMNFSSLVLAHAPMNTETVLAFYLQGLPFDLIHAVSTAAFLFLFAKPMLEKLGRIKIKYGMI